MAAELRKGQYEIGDDLVFGTRTPFAVPNQYLVQNFGVDYGDIDSVDTPMPNEDGTRFGEDFHTGMLLSFTINLWKKGQDARDDLATLQSAWDRKELRSNPGAVTTLRMSKGNRTSLVYGRPRRFKPTWGAVELGWCPIDCDFQASDEYFYDDEVQVETIGLVEAPTAGLTAPFTVPFVLAQRTISQNVIVVGGTEPTWIMMQIRGPINEPELEVDGERWWALNDSLTYADDVSIDPRHWQRMTLKNGTQNMAGKYTTDSVMLREMRLEPGEHLVVFKGIDPTLRSYVTLSWRNARKSP